MFLIWLVLRVHLPGNHHHHHRHHNRTIIT
jgi:hypothetical protein